MLIRFVAVEQKASVFEFAVRKGPINNKDVPLHVYTDLYIRIYIYIYLFIFT